MNLTYHSLMHHLFIITTLQLTPAPISLKQIFLKSTHTHIEILFVGENCGDKSGVPFLGVEALMVDDL